MDNDYNDEYEDDIEENYDSTDEDNKSFYTNNSEEDEELSENEDLKKNNSEKDENEDIEDIEDLDDIEETLSEENISDEEENENSDSDDLIEYKKTIKKYKKQNIEMFSKMGMISYLCNLVDYIKNGGYMLDNRNDLEYPNDTEESYVFESILLDTVPFEYIVNKHLINVSNENKIICLKMALRCVDENKKIFFTENFSKRFPNFKKNLFNNTISKEEIDEINNNKSSLNII